MTTVLLAGAAGLALLATAVLVIQRLYRCGLEAAKLSRAQGTFRGRREWLEARFFTLSAQSGKPRGLRWVDCDFDDDVIFAREPASGEIHAFVGVSIRFEAIEGGDMEDVEAVGNLRAATSVFCFDGSNWRTEGRSIFNLSPKQAVVHFDLQPAPIEHSAHGSS